MRAAAATTTTTTTSAIEEVLPPSKSSVCSMAKEHGKHLFWSDLLAIKLEVMRVLSTTTIATCRCSADFLAAEDVVVFPFRGIAQTGVGGRHGLERLFGTRSRILVRMKL